MNVIARIIRKIKTIKMDLQRLRYHERFVKLNHFYSPLVTFDNNARSQHQRILKKQVLGIDFELNNQHIFLERMISTQNSIPWKDTKQEGLLYCFDNRNFAYGDAITYLSMLLYFKPKQVIEIGSGYSSCVLVDSNKLFFESRIKKIFIEPYPDLLKELLGNELNTSELIASDLQNVDVSIFDVLDDNDFLFVDSTHVSKFGSDVNYILFEILPRLKEGVIIHFHDIFNKFEYPEEWLAKGRCWNESYILRAFLLNNPEYRIIYFNHMMYEENKERYNKDFFLAAKNPGGSIWLQKIKH